MKKPRLATQARESLTEPGEWDWANSRTILTNMNRALEAVTAKFDRSPYYKPEACFRRIVYRAGRAGLVHRDRIRFFVDLNENQKGRGRRSVDMFATLLHSLPQGAGAGLSKANINKTAATMRTAHEWDIHWRFYDLVVSAVGATNMMGESRALDRRPSWADGLTSAAQDETERTRKKRLTTKAKSK